MPETPNTWTLVRIPPQSWVAEPPMGSRTQLGSQGERVEVIRRDLVDPHFRALEEVRTTLDEVLALDAMDDADDVIFDKLKTLRAYLDQPALRGIGEESSRG